MKRKGSGDMQTTTSIHWNKGDIVKEHNEREEELCGNESHIDFYNDHGYSYHEVLVRTDLREAYQNIFGDALNTYNAKQKRADRRQSIDSYMQSIVDDTRGKRQTKIVNGKRVVDEDARHGKQLSYEFTVKVGNTERERDVNGRVKYNSEGHHVRMQELPRELQNTILREYARTFQQHNPNLILINADLHGDEGFYNRKGVWEYSEDHLHCEIVPVASGFKTGLSVQNSMNKAMAQMGFNTPECYQEWAKKEQERLEEITKAKYIEYCQIHPDFYRDKGDLEIIHPVADRTKEGDKSKECFALEQELDEAIHEAEAIKRMFSNGCKRNKERENDLQARENDLQAQKEALQVQMNKYAEMMQKAQIERNTTLQMQKKNEEKARELDAREGNLAYINKTALEMRNTALQMQKKNEEKERELDAREGNLAFIEETALEMQNTALQTQEKNKEKEKELNAREKMIQMNEDVTKRCREQATQEREQARQLLESVEALPKFDTTNIYITQKDWDTGKFSPPMLYSDFKEKHEATRNRLRAMLSNTQEIENTGRDGRDDWQRT